jgi:hypothetical protein
MVFSLRFGGAHMPVAAIPRLLRAARQDRRRTGALVLSFRDRLRQTCLK